MTESSEIKIVRLETDMKNVSEKLTVVNKKLDELMEKFDQMSSLKVEIRELKEEIERLKRRGAVTGWIYPTASALFTAMMVFLLMEFFRGRQ